MKSKPSPTPMSPDAELSLLPAGHPAFNEVRCCVCERVVARYPRDGTARGVMLQCPHCRALQHRHL